LSGTGGNEALVADFAAELGHLLPADHIENGSGAAESGSACIIVGLQHAASPIFLPADWRALLAIIYHVVCMICLASLDKLAVPELCPLCFALCFLSQPNMPLFSVLYHTKGCICTAHFVAQIEIIVF